MSDRLADREYSTLAVGVGDAADRVATLTIDRPEQRNALNQTVRSEVKDAIAVAEADEAVRAVVLTGSEASSAFAAGADVAELKDRDALDQRTVSDRPRIYDAVYEATVPVIARVNGHALGGGCELAQACDVRIAEEDVKLGQPEINLGIIPGGGGTQRLPRLIGTGQAMRLILSGELVDAEEAAEIGLVEEVCAADELDERVYGLAGEMAKKSPVALELAKTAVQASDRLDLDAGQDYERELFSHLFATRDKDEGIEAFFEDRDPEFTGE